nr:Hpt domain-containing protein [Vibrio anguillarum]
MRSYGVILFGWLISVGLVFWQSHLSYQAMHAVKELHYSVEELKSSLYFKEPYRSTRANDIALNVQRLYSLRLQLEVEHRDFSWRPDIQQLLHVTDRYITLTKSYLSIELNIQPLVERLQVLRDNPTNSEQLKQMYVVLGAYVFEAMFSDTEQNPGIYRALDKLYVDGQSLPAIQKKELEQTLAQASDLLNQYAQGARLVDNLINHSIYNQLIHVENQYHRLLNIYAYLVTGLSGGVMLLLGWLMFRSSVLTRSHVNKVPSAAKEDTSSEINPSRVLSTEEPQVETSDLSDDLAIDIESMLITLNGDVESVTLLLSVFIQDHQHDATELKRLVHSDLEAAQRRAHSLKGVAGNLGCRSLKQIASEIELRLSQKQRPTEKQLELLTTQLAAAIASAQHYLDQRKR